MQSWVKQVDKIQQATKLRIELFSCLQEEWEDARESFEAQGGEVVCFRLENKKVWYVGISRNEWPDAAKAMLPMMFPISATEPSVHEQLAEWLRQVWAGEMTGPPASLATGRHWMEPRICFAMERIGERQSRENWRELLESFFSGAAQLLFLPLSSSVDLLIIPASILLETANDQDKPEDVWLEWAYSLEDLLTTEASESVRILLTQPVHQLSELAVAVRSLHRLSMAMRYIPKKRVAATWQYRLEQWAASLDETSRQRFLSTFSSHQANKLTKEQTELLEEFFRQNLNVSETSRSLYIHRNTLLYRLDKITEQTALDPRVFQDAVYLRLILLFRQFD